MGDQTTYFLVPPGAVQGIHIDHMGLFKYDVSVFWAFWTPIPPPLSAKISILGAPPFADVILEQGMR